MARRLGNRGEKALARWASQLDITISPPDEDLHGWDYLLEFPLEVSNRDQSEEGKPLDKMASPLKCWIQVKSTDGQPGRWSVKLSNWRKLIRNPYPAFFLILEFDNENDCQRAFLVHIDKFYIERVQKRLRGLKPEQKSNLHHHYVDFVYSEQDALASLDGEGLTNAILDHVSTNLESYIEEKRRLVDTVGYEDYGEMSLEIKLPDESTNPIEYIGDLSIGLISHVEASKFEFKDIRFGIKALKPALVLRDAQLSMPDLEAHAQKATVRFFTTDDQDELRVRTQLFVSNAFGPELADQYAKIRLQAPFIQLTSDFIRGKGRINFTLPGSESVHPLEDLRVVAEFILLLQEASKRNVEVKSELEYEGEVFPGGAINIDAKFDDPYVINAARSIFFAWQIAKHFDIQQEIETSILELLPQSSALDPIRRTLDHVQANYQLKTTVMDAEGGEVFIKELVCAPIVLAAKLGHFVVALGYAVVGGFRVFSTISDRQMHLEAEINQVESIERKLFRDESSVLDVTKAQCRRLGKIYSSSHIVIWPNDMALIEGVAE